MLEFSQLIPGLCLALCLIALPYDLVLNRILLFVREINAKMDKPQYLMRLSGAPFCAVISAGADFAKGYFLFPVAQMFFSSEVLILVFVGSALALHIWSPFLLFKNRYHLFFIISGLYFFMDPIFLWLFPLCYGLAALLFNSLALGYLVSVSVVFLWIWLFNLDPFYLFNNFLVFVVVFAALGIKIFAHFEQSPNTLLKSFLQRD